VSRPLAEAREIDGWRNNFQIATSEKTGASFDSISESSVPALHFDAAGLIAQLADSETSLLHSLGPNMHASLAHNVITLTYSASLISNAIESVRFDLGSKADLAFVSELQYMLDLPARLKSVQAIHAALNDEHQDLIVLSFASFTGLLEKYGRESEQLKGALRMLNEVFPSLSANLAALFTTPASAVQSLVFLGAHNSVLEKQDPREVENLLKADNVKTYVQRAEQAETVAETRSAVAYASCACIHHRSLRVMLMHLCRLMHVSAARLFCVCSEYYPNLYLPTGDVSAVCASLALRLSALHYTAYCPTDSVAGVHPSMFLENIPIIKLAAPTVIISGRRIVQPVYTYPSNDELQRYQIVLWFSIGFAFVLLAAVYQLAFMGFKKDTMLYSSFNPNWEDRKRR
jgi:hypothetical protein